MSDLFNAVLRPLEYCVAWIMVGSHSILTRLGMPGDGGLTWALSIVGLVLVIRILLIPLFVKQIKASRGMQMIQPELKKIQDRYKGRNDQESRQKMTEETLALYKREGTNPFSSCMPILLQSPIFFALFRVLNGIPKHQTIGPLNETLVEQVDSATLFGAPLSDTFMSANSVSTQVLTVVLIILMSATTFTTQRQLMMKNMPATALDNPFAQQQKIMLYVLPLIFAVSGVNFPIGVLIYWLTTNVWSMGQQFYVIHRMPAPGSPAEKAMQERKARRGRGKESKDAGTAGATDEQADAAAGQAGRVSGQRQQPKRQAKSKRGSGATRGPGPTGPVAQPKRAAGEAARRGEGELGR